MKDLRRRPVRIGIVIADDFLFFDFNAPVAQLVEHSTFNAGVTGSNPVGRTIFKSRTCFLL